MLEIISDPQSMRSEVLKARAAGHRIGFVPTMGALHAGHASLVARAVRECEAVAVSIFVNPTQFGPAEDFERYPRQLQADCQLLNEWKVRWVFAPEAADIYPPGAATRVVVGGPAGCFEGEVRPGHFEGVATVVCRLFLAVPAEAAYFGAKDWQQTLVIKRMVCDLGLAVDVVVCPTVREPDGLAMSSRNALLTPDERHRAVALFESLCCAERMWLAGFAVAGIEQAMREALQARSVSVDYAVVVAADSLEPYDASLAVSQSGAKALPVPVALVAGRVGSTRLIDNRVLPART